MLVLALDTENTGAVKNKANPFDKENRCCILSIVTYDTETKEQKRYTWDIEYSVNSPYLLHVIEIQSLVNKAAWVGLMNAKYDMHWCKRYGINLDDSRIWDVSVGHFIMDYQQQRYPSLNDIAVFHNLPTKLDIVKTQYWEQGLDTDAVPYDILVEYCEHDTWLTLEIMLRQFKLVKNVSRGMRGTILAAFEDIHNLAEMEWNGFLYDLDLGEEKSIELSNRLAVIDQELIKLFNIPEYVPVNFNSGDQLSCLLYGGNLKYVEKEEYLFHYKDPKKESKIKTRSIEREYKCERIFQPIPKSELAKEGYYSTNETTLKKIKTNRSNKVIVELLLERAKIEKLNSTYFIGFPKLMIEKNWGNVIHSGFNQVVAVSGRLSSNAPNLQNVPPDHKVCFISRFPPVEENQ